MASSNFTHLDLLKKMPEVRRTFVENFDWFIHITPSQNLSSIQRSGLMPYRHNRYKNEEAQLSELPLFEDNNPAVLCLKPLGSQGKLGGTSITFDKHSKEEFVALAVKSVNLPEYVAVDYTGAWEQIKDRIENAPTIEAAALNIAFSLGRVISFEAIKPEHLQVCCMRNLDQNQLTPEYWPHLLDASDTDVAKLSDESDSWAILTEALTEDRDKKTEIKSNLLYYWNGASPSTIAQSQ